MNKTKRLRLETALTDLILDLFRLNSLIVTRETGWSRGSG